MISQEIIAKLFRLEDLPTLPAVMVRILETIENERSSTNDLTEIMECDQVISVRVLRMANSAFYGLPRNVDSIRRAVVTIGFDAVKMLALATSVFDAISFKDPTAFDIEDFWMHGLGAAKSAQWIAKHHVRVSSPDACFTAGLMHDIGKLLLALSLKERYKAICEQAIRAGLPLRTAEYEQLGTDHAEVGEWIGRMWKFPEAITDAIGHQYSAASYEGPHGSEARIVALSDVISRLAGFGLAGDPMPPPDWANPEKLLGLDGKAVTQIADGIKRTVEETRNFLNLMQTAA